MLMGAVWMVLTGKIVPGSIYQKALDRIDLLERRLEERDKQVAELMELSRTAVAVVDALPKVRDPA